MRWDAGGGRVFRPTGWQDCSRGGGGLSADDESFKDVLSRPAGPAPHGTLFIYLLLFIIKITREQGPQGPAGRLLPYLIIYYLFIYSLFMRRAGPAGPAGLPYGRLLLLFIYLFIHYSGRGCAGGGGGRHGGQGRACLHARRPGHPADHRPAVPLYTEHYYLFIYLFRKCTAQAARGGRKREREDLCLKRPGREKRPELCPVQAGWAGRSRER